jgi:DNA end-binding protein Ku
METMLFPDEVVAADSIEELAAAEGDVKTTKRELDMAKQLIESLSGDFEASQYKDEYREAVLDLIERKAAGETITIEAPEPEHKEVPDLMAALEASIASSKSPPKKRTARSSNGSGSGTKKKKTAAKK